jgi:hypothetical protein
LKGDIVYLWCWLQTNFKMVKHFKIFTLLLLTKFSLLGQVTFIKKAFHKHFQTCHFVGTTEEDYIIVLDRDSTIQLIKYSSNYRDQYNTVVRQTYVGTYSKFGDTIRVKFTDHSSTTKNKIIPPNIIYSANKFDTLFNVGRVFQYPPNTIYSAKKVDTLFKSGRILQYPPATYIVSADKIISADSLFPTLPNSTRTNIMLLESKFMNWDKNSIYKKEVFGLSK